MKLDKHLNVAIDKYFLKKNVLLIIFMHEVTLSSVTE